MSSSLSLSQDRPAGHFSESTLGDAVRLANVQLYSLREYAAGLRFDALARDGLNTLQAHIDCTLHAALEQLDGIAVTLAGGGDTAAKPFPYRKRLSVHVRVQDVLDKLYKVYDELEDIAKGCGGNA
jgi:hypothetical protein